MTREGARDPIYWFISRKPTVGAESKPGAKTECLPYEWQKRNHLNHDTVTPSPGCFTYEVATC